DCWVHEQDIRRAVNRPGNLDGPVAAAALGRFTGSLGYIAGKKAGAPEGATVVLDIEGPMAETIGVVVSEGRARPIEAEAMPGNPTVRLTMTAETFVCLAAGRWAPDEAVAGGKVAIAGDGELAQRVLASMAIIP